MALTVNHPTLKEQTIYAHSPSIGTTPIVAVARAPFRGVIVKLGLVVNGAFTTNNTLTCAIIPAGTTSGTNITGGVVTTTAASSGAGTTGTAVPTALNLVNEDDLITFTPSGSTGATVTGTCFAVIQTA